MELFLSVLSRTYIKLQTTFDRYFVMHGMTAQEAAILVRCSEATETSPGGLAFSLGRDKGQMSRFVQRLETKGLISRKVSSRDHRRFVLKATSSALRMVPGLVLTFENIRTQLLAQITAHDIERMGLVLNTVLKNAEKMRPDTESL
jgi:DNA-binding MarR family transcriptional regulator